MEKHVDGKTTRRPRNSAKKGDGLSIEVWPVGRLVEYANNPRNHDNAIEKMAATIKEFGFKVPIVARSNGDVVDGHLRLKAARFLGLKSVPVVLADDLSADQVRAFRLSVNQATTWASWNVDLLESELAQLRAVDFDLEPLGLDSIELPDIEEQLTTPSAPRANRTKTTIFLSVRNEDVVKTRKVITAALDKAKVAHNL